MEKKSVPSDSKKEHIKIQETLIQNLIELQRVHTNLLEKFDKISNQLSSLLSLFESAAKSYAENPGSKITEKDNEFLEKIDKLLEQNKTLAKGLTLIEDRTRQKIYGPGTVTMQNSPTIEKDENEGYSPSYINKPLPKF
ncbi:MAG: hypothetical protein AABX35_01210 [Nanoarchaeota archaeon]